MDSSFLTGIHVGLALFAVLSFLKMVIQFGLPNHPARFVSYLVGLCVATYFIALASTDLNFISPWDWMKWKALPMIAGSLCLLLLTIMMIGSFSLIQQKVVSRLPVMGALLCFAFFPHLAEWVMIIFLSMGGLFLIVSVQKARYQKRLFLKMYLMLLVVFLLKLIGHYSTYFLAEIILFFGVFYLFLFLQTFAISSMMEDFVSQEGDV